MAWMRRQTDPDPTPASAPKQSEPRAPQPTSAAPAARETRPMDKLVNIGQSVEIKGELTGNEDLTIEGKVEGKITLKDHALTIGANGRIHGEIVAKAVTVVGQVDGNIAADDKVEVAATGSMKGDIVAPRVILADGARFKGTIDMDSKRAPGGAATPASSMKSPGTSTSTPGPGGGGGKPSPTPAGVGAKG